MEKEHHAMHDDYGNLCTHKEPCNCHCDYADCPYFTALAQTKKQRDALLEAANHAMGLLDNLATNQNEGIRGCTAYRKLAKTIASAEKQGT